MRKEQTYREIKPIKKMDNLIHSFWMHHNLSDKPEQITIVPDGYFKIVFVVQDNKILKYFLTGLWFREKDIITPPIFHEFWMQIKNISC